MRGVGVFPSCVEDAAVVEDGGTPVVILVEAELSNGGTVGIHYAEICDGVASADTWYACEASCGVEDYSSVW